MTVIIIIIITRFMAHVKSHSQSEESQVLAHVGHAHVTQVWHALEQNDIVW